MNKIIAVTIGDIEGVGVELLIKIFNSKKIIILFYLLIIKYLNHIF